MLYDNKYNISAVPWQLEETYTPAEHQSRGIGDSCRMVHCGTGGQLAAGAIVGAQLAGPWSGPGQLVLGTGGQFCGRGRGLFTSVCVHRCQMSHPFHQPASQRDELGGGG